jgi:hypothetical protein
MYQVCIYIIASADNRAPVPVLPLPASLDSQPSCYSGQFLMKEIVARDAFPEYRTPQQKFRLVC